MTRTTLKYTVEFESRPWHGGERFVVARFAELSHARKFAHQLADTVYLVNVLRGSKLLFSVHANGNCSIEKVEQ